jgi:hypothetical protein
MLPDPLECQISPFTVTLCPLPPAAITIVVYTSGSGLPVQACLTDAAGAGLEEPGWAFLGKPSKLKSHRDVPNP